LKRLSTIRKMIDMVFKKGEQQSWRNKPVQDAIEERRTNIEQKFSREHTHKFDNFLGQSETSQAWGCDCGEVEVRDKKTWKDESKGKPEQEFNRYPQRAYQEPTEDVLTMWSCLDDSEKLSKDFKWIQEHDLARLAVALFQARYSLVKPKKKGFWRK
jgi:hypothetical protein